MNIKSLGISLAVVSALSLSFTGCGEEGAGKTEQTLSKSYIQFIGTDERDFASASAYDSSNNLFVAGITQGRIMDVLSVNAGEYDMYLRKLDSDGNTLCTFQYGTSGDDLTEGIVVDSFDNVYVAGTTSEDFDGQIANGSSDIFLMKFNSSCEKQKTILIGSTEAEGAKGLSIDSDDNLYLTGWTSGSIDSQPKKGDSYADWIITKLDTDLTQIWTTQDGSNGDDWTEDIAVDNSGSLYVVGSLNNDIEGFTDVKGYEDGFVAKYNTGDGSRIWIQNFGSSNDSGGNDQATSVAVTSSGDAVVGFSFVGIDDGVAYFDKDGAQRWQVGTESLGNIIVGVGKDDTIYSTDNSADYSARIKKHNAQTGEVIWTEVLDPTWSRGYASIEDFIYNPNDGYMYGSGASESNFQDPYGADNNHSGTYDGFIVKFK